MSTPLKETVILVHGTFGQSDHDGASRWYEPGQVFCTNLDAELAGLGSNARCWAHLEQVSSPVAAKVFTWSGLNSWTARLNASKRLEQYLRALRADGWKCHIIAHSHGGNVVLDALRFLKGGPPDWFNGKVVLYGTPILSDNFTRRSKRLWEYILWLSLVPALWLSPTLYILYMGLHFIFMSISTLAINLSIIFVSLFLITILYYLYGEYKYIYQQYIRHESRSNDYFAERLLVINSQYDEAYRLLYKTKNENNPLELNKVRRRKNENITRQGVLRAILGEIVEQDRYLFIVESISSHIFFLVLLMVYGSMVYIVLLKDLPPFIWWLVLDISIILLFFLGIFSSFFPGSSLSAAAIPYRLVRSFILAILITFRTVLLRLLDPLLRRLTWKTLQLFTFGLLGSPYEVDNLDVELKPSRLDDTQYTYLELPEDIVHRALKSRSLYVEANAVGILDKLLDETIPLVDGQLAAFTDIPLLHTCYYQEEKCITKAASWLSKEVRLHTKEIAMAGRVVVFGSRDPEDYDPEFDSGSAAWDHGPGRNH